MERERALAAGLVCTWKAVAVEGARVEVDVEGGVGMGPKCDIKEGRGRGVEEAPVVVSGVDKPGCEDFVEEGVGGMVEVGLVGEGVRDGEGGAFDGNGVAESCEEDAVADAVGAGRALESISRGTAEICADGAVGDFGGAAVEGSDAVAWDEAAAISGDDGVFDEELGVVGIDTAFCVVDDLGAAEMEVAVVGVDAEVGVGAKNGVVDPQAAAAALNAGILGADDLEAGEVGGRGSADKDGDFAGRAMKFGGVDAADGDDVGACEGESFEIEGACGDPEGEVLVIGDGGHGGGERV